MNKELFGKHGKNTQLFPGLFMAKVLILFPLKTTEKQSCSGVSMG